MTDRVRLLLAVVGAMFLLGVAPVWAEEFSLYEPEVEVRWIQYCQHCREALVVTNLPDHAEVRCPSCLTVQTRLPKQFLKIETLQVCPTCGRRIHIGGHGLDTKISCAGCGHLQRVVVSVTQPARNGDGGITLPVSPQPSDSLPRLENIITIRKRLTLAAQLRAQAERIVLDLPAPQAESSSADEGGGRNVPPPVAVAVRGDRGASVLVHAADATVDIPGTTPSAVGIAAAVLPFPVPVTEGPIRIDDAKGEVRVSSENPPAQVIESVPAKVEGKPTQGGALAPPIPVYQPPRLRVVAMVNSRPITAEELELRLSYVLDKERRVLAKRGDTPEGRRSLMARTVEIRKQVLQDVIDETILLEAAAGDGIVLLEGELHAAIDKLRLAAQGVDLSTDMLEQIRRDLIVQKMQDLHGKVDPPSPAAVRRYYLKQAAINEFQTPSRYRLRALVIYHDRTGRLRKDSAKAVMDFAHSAILEEGDFVAAVKRYSEGPFAESGGIQIMNDETLLFKDALALPLQEALEHSGAGVGMVVGPVPLAHCLVLLRVEEHREKQTLPLRELYSQLEKHLHLRLRKRAFQRYLRLQRQNADIRVYE